MTGLSFEQLRDLSGGRLGVTDAPCPLCGPDRRSSVNQRRKVLRIWCDDPSFLTYHCPRCPMNGYAAANGDKPSRISTTEREKIRAEVAVREAAHAKIQRMKSIALWRRGFEPGLGTPPHAYLRQARCYGGRIPATIRYLPPSRDYPAAMVAAIGIAREMGPPGELVIDDAAIRGVHITSLKSDGSGKAGTERDKIMIGRSVGSPIVLAPPNDGLGLAICEGIEDGLSIFESTGLGVWAAGSASRMSALAPVIPDYIDAITIVSDADFAGRTNAQKLADALTQHPAEVRLVVPSNDRRAA
jgi:Toprim domain